MRCSGALQAALSVHTTSTDASGARIEEEVRACGLDVAAASPSPGADVAASRYGCGRGEPQSRCGCPHALQVLVIVSEVRPGLKLSKAEIDAVLFAIRAAVGAERATRGNPACNTKLAGVICLA